MKKIRTKKTFEVYVKFTVEADDIIEAEKLAREKAKIGIIVISETREEN